MNDNQLEKLYGLLKEFSTAMLITMGGPGSCHARPMAIAKVDENTGLWFFTARDSEKVSEIEADSRSASSLSGWMGELCGPRRPSEGGGGTCGDS